jgi:hypothetical protein
VGETSLFKLRFFYIFEIKRLYTKKISSANIPDTRWKEVPERKSEKIPDDTCFQSKKLVNIPKHTKKSSLSLHMLVLTGLKK